MVVLVRDRELSSEGRGGDGDMPHLVSADIFPFFFAAGGWGKGGAHEDASYHISPYPSSR